MKNIKRVAKKLVKFYEDEKKNLPLIPLKNGALEYKNYLIKQDSKEKWAVYLLKGKRLEFVDKFNLKSSACMAARHYDRNDIMGVKEIHIIDSGYWNNHVDSEFFRYRFKTTKDSDKRDLFLWRWEITNQRAKFYKGKITTAFTHAFR
jgi:hypothetical protein